MSRPLTTSEAALALPRVRWICSGSWKSLVSPGASTPWKIVTLAALPTRTQHFSSMTRTRTETAVGGTIATAGPDAVAGADDVGVGGGVRAVSARVPPTAVSVRVR